ncbi:MAG: FtsX-like permease family protein [Methyloprofundus sp.]|uniref:ABC transporter permease n=1 Tax=Methyloprofundus sp. TaxID=2020875 RepID=UPI001A143B8B|nr:FtsX-like permease family protein [Methyloprofundus sp.]HIL77333.1 FtsX-like permease family protein [Methylococcales bacterium]
MNRLLLALRFLRRDSRSGELSLLMMALIIAVASATSISLFADRINRTMNFQAAEFLAADLVLTSPGTIADNILKKAHSLYLKQSHGTDFSTMLMENDEFLLAAIKAVSSHYPLYGYLKIRHASYAEEQTVYHGPEIGKAWVESRILSALHLRLGGQIRVGEKSLLITQILTYEPDKQGDFYSLSPRVMINSQDLAATKILQPGSHVHHFYQFAGDESSILSFKHWLEPQLSASQRIVDVYEDRPKLGSALEKAERYLGLSSIVVILISGVAIAMATRRYSERHFNSTAILRCLGYRQNAVLQLFLWQFLFIGLIASAIGCLLGWITQEFLLYTLRELLPAKIAAPGILAVLFGIMMGIVVLFGFALPPLLRLKQVSPLRILRRDLEPLPSSAWLVYGLALTLLCILITQYTEDMRMTLSIIGASALSLLMIGGLVYLILGASRSLLAHVNLTWRFGLQGLSKNRHANIVQILAFSLTLLAIILSFTVRSDLINDWQKQLADDAPNHFALNVFADQKDRLQLELKQQGIDVSYFYPVVRGRLVEINAMPVQQVVTKESQGERAIHRDLSLTWAQNYAEDNKIIAGEWQAQRKPGLVSIEQKLAKSLKVKVGDTLTFSIGSQQINAQVDSIRKVDWDTMKPNFYMMFSPGSIDQFAHTYITSFYLPAEKKDLLNQLVKHYPAMTVLDVELLLQQINRILTQLTAAINYLLYFSLLAGFMVLFAAVQTSLDSRIYSGVLMRTLGAKRSFLQKIQWIEFSILGFIAGTLAVLMAQLVIYGLYHWVLKLDFTFNLELLIIIPIVSALFIGFAGVWGTRSVVNQSPMRVLREL